MRRALAWLGDRFKWVALVATALGLGFALRLVRNFAEAAGGGLHIGPERFYLYLPPLEVIERSYGQGS